jgi:hypothetical protein
MVGQLYHSLIATLALTFIVVVDAIAEDRIIEWLPAGLHLPSDAKVRNEREIGAFIRLLTFETFEDGTELLAVWEQKLVNEGYNITLNLADGLDSVIEFSGNGIDNGKIIALPASQSTGETVISIDANFQ